MREHVAPSPRIPLLGFVVGVPRVIDRFGAGQLHLPEQLQPHTCQPCLGGLQTLEQLLDLGDVVAAGDPRRKRA